MKFLSIVLLLIFALCPIVDGKTPYVVVLGVAQDAGVPQIGCTTAFCREAWKNEKLRRKVASIALVDPDSKKRWVFDATPDFSAQFAALQEITDDYSNDLTGIFLTHAHIGHYTGLMYLGREALNAKEVKVFAMPRMKTMLETNAPWSQLVGIKNIALQPLENKKSVALAENLRVEPFLVPHRDEFSETVGYKITFKDKSLVFIPDIDKWEKWSENLENLVKTNDYLLLDGTFFADGEINRPMSEVPHPFVSETMKLLEELPPGDKRKILFIHFNHTNPLVQRDRKKIAEVRAKGFDIAFERQIFNF